MSKRTRENFFSGEPEGRDESSDGADDGLQSKRSRKRGETPRRGPLLPLDDIVLPDVEDTESADLDAADADASLDPNSSAAVKPPEPKSFTFTVEEEHADTRIDLYLTLKIDGYSRVFLRRVVALDQVLVDGRPVKPAFHVFPGQVVHVIDLPPPPTAGPIPEAIPLDILYEDDYIVAINKPPGMVVHPAKGHWSGTLTAALAHHFAQLSDAGGPTRPGIVHRLDRETSGVIVIAKTNEVHYKLCAQFEAREVHKTYMTIVSGQLDRDRDRIIQPIGHHPYQREKRAIRSGHPSSRYAETQFEVVERFPGYALLRVFPKTGRTHQIRLHLAHIGCPVLCDRLYAGHAQITQGQLHRRLARGLPLHPEDSEVVLTRQALHAHEIEFTHPKTQQALRITSPLPADFQRVCEVLRQA